MQVILKNEYLLCKLQFFICVKYKTNNKFVISKKKLLYKIRRIDFYII